MSSVSKDEIAQAKKLDLLSYLQAVEPDELKYRGGNEYSTVTHSSLVISNGMWIWNKNKVGGKTALDYLIHVKGMDFVPAVKYLCELSPAYNILPVPAGKEKTEAKKFELPPKHTANSKVSAYLQWRGISPELVNYCIKHNLIYESKNELPYITYYNCVFVGYDRIGKAAYGMQRGCFTDFCGEVAGSNKSYGFKLELYPAEKKGILVASESAVDALSLATFDFMEKQSLKTNNIYLSLGGNSMAALNTYLDENPHIQQVVLALDNDEAGKTMAEKIGTILKKERGCEVFYKFPLQGKDYNEHLLISQGLSNRIIRRKKESNKQNTR